MSGPAADGAEKYDGRILATEAGGVPVIIGGQTQPRIKVTTRARREEIEKENEAKAAEENGKGRRKAIGVPAEDKVKGK